MIRQHGLERAGFGRRGGQSIAAPPGASTGGPRPPVKWSDEPAETSASRLKPAALLLIALLAPICLEAMLSGTSLITPINPLLVNVMRIIGFVLGIPLALLVVLKPSKPMGVLKSLAVLLLIPLFTGFAGDRTAWRIADWVLFSSSSEQFTPADYPIKYASHGRKGRRDSFAIDPFDVKGSTDIAVPSAQFEAIWLHASDYCIRVMQRRSASGAVEIINDGVFTLLEPAPAVLTPCPKAPGREERTPFRR